MDTQQRWRVTFARGTPIKYVSHLDLCRAWERTFRRAGLPLAYTQGFNPQARLQLAAALPVGYTGSAELMDVILTRVVEAADFLALVQPALPRGLAVVEVYAIDLKAPSLQSSLRQAEYRVTIRATVSPSEIERRIEHFLSLKHFEQRRVRKQRAETIDLRPLVDDVQLTSLTPDHSMLWMRLQAGATGSVRPDTVLDALGLLTEPLHVERTRLILVGND
jgi:radical SAM-linked protein